MSSQVKDFVPEFRRNLRVRVLRPVLQVTGLPIDMGSPGLMGI